MRHMATGANLVPALAAALVVMSVVVMDDGFPVRFISAMRETGSALSVTILSRVVRFPRPFFGDLNERVPQG
jgi:hypothetical protein